jgi:membrane protease YdiL (CAAX protease family)
MATQTLTGRATLVSWIRRFTARHPLALFFILAFGISWAFLVADALGSQGIIPFRLPLNGPGILLALIMSYGPTIAAFCVARITGGKEGVKSLLALLNPRRAGAHWYILAIAGPALFALSIAMLQELFGATRRPFELPLYQLILAGIVGSVIHAIANGEELGWRGYALPLLQRRYTALTASLLLGLIWWAFHMPIMFTVGGIGGSQSLSDALPFLCRTLLLSVIMTWVFNTTRGGMLPIILLHGALNTWPDLIATQGGELARAWVENLPLLLVAAILLLRFGAARLSPTVAHGSSQ